MSLLNDLPPEEDGRPVSRRTFVSGVLAGGAAGLAAAAGTGLGVWRAMDVQGQQALEAAQGELDRLQGLVDRYEMLEKIGLDAIVETGMAALAAPLGLVEGGAKLLQAGLEWIEGAVEEMREAVGGAQEAVAWLEERAAALGRAFDALGKGLAVWFGKALDSPVAEAMRAAVNWILDHLPFDLGDKIRGALESAADLVDGVQELVGGTAARALAPLRRWFAVEAGAGLIGGLLGAIVERVLDPLEAHLGDLAALADTWRHKMEAPAKAALEERARAREEIGRYKQEHGLR